MRTSADLLSWHLLTYKCQLSSEAPQLFAETLIQTGLKWVEPDEC